MTEQVTDSDTPIDAPLPSILCVDDEPGILSALRRLFRAKGFDVRVAEGGLAGLEALAQQSADVVISDMRMPQMDGVAFLAQVRQRWPDTMRLLLTGYADITSTMGAINEGEIFRYIAKPWDDNDILLIVRSALQQRSLELERRRLQALVAAQNNELKKLNADLEGVVAERTAKLEQTLAAVKGANERLKNNFITSVKVFTNLIELRKSDVAGHSRRVAELSRRIALQLKLDSKIVHEVFIAGLLHEVGKVGFPDDMIDTPVVMLTTKQLEQFRKHPARAAELLMPLAEIRGSVEMIASQLERFDGAGYPQRLAGEQIPIGSRILIVACDYDSLQIGLLGQRKLDPAQAQKAILQGSGRRYDPEVVDAFMVLHGGMTRDEVQKTQRAECTLPLRELLPGMVLSHDLITPSGLLMLTAGHVLDDVVIRKIIDFEHSSGLRLTADIWQDTKP